MRLLNALSLAMRVAAHALLFLVAALVFFLGLGIGLQVNSALGSALWVAAGAIVALNLYLISKRLR